MRKSSIQNAKWTNGVNEEQYKMFPDTVSESTLQLSSKKLQFILYPTEKNNNQWPATI
jgi:hypothetical protein